MSALLSLSAFRLYPLRYMDFSKTFDQYTNRRDLLRGFLDEYLLLAEEQPDLAAQFTFSAFVNFSFAYFKMGRNTEQLGNMHKQLVQVGDLLATQSLASL